MVRNLKFDISIQIRLSKDCAQYWQFNIECNLYKQPHSKLLIGLFTFMTCVTRLKHHNIITMVIFKNYQFSILVIRNKFECCFKLVFNEINKLRRMFLNSKSGVQPMTEIQANHKLKCNIATSKKSHLKHDISPNLFVNFSFCNIKF